MTQVAITGLTAEAITAIYSQALLITPTRFDIVRAKEDKKWK